MEEEQQRIGRITIDIYPGGVKKATFQGEVQPNDITYSKITLQTDYARYLNECHRRNRRKASEDKRIQAEKDQQEHLKELKVQQEQETEEVKLEEQLRVLEAKIEEVENTIRAEENTEVKVQLQRELITLRKEQSDLRA